MAEPGDHIKSLKPFHDILISAEADYWNADTDERDGVIESIMDKIRVEAGKKKVNLANDGIFYNVSPCTPSLYRL